MSLSALSVKIPFFCGVQWCFIIILFQSHTFGQQQQNILILKLFWNMTICLTLRKTMTSARHRAVLILPACCCLWTCKCMQPTGLVLQLLLKPSGQYVDAAHTKNVWRRCFLFWHLKEYQHKSLDILLMTLDVSVHICADFSLVLFHPISSLSWC